MPYGSPFVVPSTRLDLTISALKNLKRGIGIIGEPAATPHNFAKALPQIGVAATVVGFNNGPQFIMDSLTANDVLTSLDDVGAWGTTACGGVVRDMEFNCSAALALQRLLLVNGVGIRLSAGSGGALPTTVKASANNLVSIASANKKDYGLNADGLGRTVPTIIAVGDNCAVERSTDGGLTWTTIAIGGAGTEDFSSVISNGTGVWIAMGLTAALAQTMIRSLDDGLTWTFFTPTIQPTKVYFGLSMFIGIRNNGGTAEVMTSVNGIDWEVVYSQAGWTINDINFDQNGIVLACGSAGQFLITDDLEEFTQAFMPVNYLGGNTGNGATSLDGVSTIDIRTLFFCGSFTNKNRMFSDNRWILSVTQSTNLNFRTWVFASQNIVDQGT